MLHVHPSEVEAGGLQQRQYGGIAHEVDPGADLQLAPVDAGPQGIGSHFFLLMPRSLGGPVVRVNPRAAGTVREAAPVRGEQACQGYQRVVTFCIRCAATDPAPAPTLMPRVKP